MAYNVESNNAPKKKEGKDDKALLDLLVNWVDHAEEMSKDYRELAEKCRDYYDGAQWTDAEKKKLDERNQPDTVNNRIKPKVDTLLGTERSIRTDPKAFPRNMPSDEKAAEAATDALRFIADSNKFNHKKSKVFENMCIEGYGAAKIEVYPDYKNPEDYEICVKRLQWDRLFYDPHSREIDFSDAKYRGEYIWMDLEDAIDMFPDKKRDLTNACEVDIQEGESFDDKPNKHQWIDKKRKRVKIVECWYKKGSREAQTHKVCRAIFTKGVLLEGPTESLFKDEKGFQEDPYEFMSAYVDKDGGRYGVVKQYLGPQDEINKRRSKALHLANTRQVRVDPQLKTQYQSITKLRQELNKPDGVIFAKEGEVEVIGNSDVTSVNLQLMQEAKQEIDAVGVNAALTGKATQDMSGRALQSRQQAGYMELGTLFDNLRLWQWAMYKKCWNRVKQYWTAEKWVRVTDDEQKVKFVALNKPLTYGEVYQQSNGQLPAPPPEMANQPVTLPDGKPSMVQNNVAEIDVDIILDEVPDTVAIQQEQFETLATIVPQLANLNPGLAQPLSEALFEASSIRNKDKIIEKLKGGADPVQAQVQQMQMQIDQIMKKLMVEKAQADVENIKADTMQKKASAIKDMSQADKHHADIEIGFQPPPQITQ